MRAQQIFWVEKLICRYYLFKLNKVFSSTIENNKPSNEISSINSQDEITKILDNRNRLWRK